MAGAGAVQSPASYPVFYSFHDLNHIANELDKHFDGEWEVTRESGSTAPTWATLTTSQGQIVYRFNSHRWWAQTTQSSPRAHRDLIEGFLQAVGVDAQVSTATAQRIVNARTADDWKSCTGPGQMALSTYRSDNEWVTFFDPVLVYLYLPHPAC